MTVKGLIQQVKCIVTTLIKQSTKVSDTVHVSNSDISNSRCLYWMHPFGKIVLYTFYILHIEISVQLPSTFDTAGFDSSIDEWQSVLYSKHALALMDSDYFQHTVFVASSNFCSRPNDGSLVEVVFTCLEEGDVGFHTFVTLLLPPCLMTFLHQFHGCELF